MKILVGLSGGVDSALAAALLKEAGHQVTGAIMSIWDESLPTPPVPGKACLGPEEGDIKTARSVADALGIDFAVIDCREQYKKIVIENFKEEYRLGRTPNPCVWCNSFIKFGALPTAARAQGISFDKFATGHYARIEFDNASSRWQLKTAFEAQRDQTYFLYRLTQDQLATTLFPLGEFKKSRVRELATEKAIPVAQKADSQDFYCGDYNDILKFQPKPGSIIDKKTGKVLGQHEGIWNYTIGKRKGLGIGGTKEPLYVVDILPAQNVVLVGGKEDLYSDILIAKDLNWGSIAAPAGPLRCHAKIRQMHTPAAAIVTPLANNIADVKFDEPQMSITSGQSVVFYDGDLVLGGGIIS